MARRFEARITLARLPLSPQAVRALRKLKQYDLIVFTSKNARRFFMQALRERRISLPKKSRIVQVGPRTDLLKLPVKNKRILFPRSAIAPYDIVRQLRARGASVRVIPLYTARGAPLSRAKKEELLQGKIKKLYFRSPSGITGLLKQFRGSKKKTILAIPAHCIGETTARAARAAGFKKVFAKGIL